MHFLGNPDRRRMDPPFFAFRGPNLCYDIIRRRDMMPVLGRVLSGFPLFFSADFRRFRSR
jgi:hypothetical protein